MVQLTSTLAAFMPLYGGPRLIKIDEASSIRISKLPVPKSGPP
jgi:hypothetical protein